MLSKIQSLWNLTNYPSLIFFNFDKNVYSLLSSIYKHTYFLILL